MNKPRLLLAFAMATLIKAPFLFADTDDPRFFTIHSTETTKIQGPVTAGGRGVQLRFAQGVSQGQGVGMGKCRPETPGDQTNSMLLRQFSHSKSKGPGAGKSPNQTFEFDPFDLLDVNLDRIINIGKKVWNLVKAGESVTDLQWDVGAALPEGLDCWMGLEKWQMPKSETYSVSHKNLYGIEVVRFVYRVSYLYGGSSDGVGAYIGYAAIEPVDLKILWGFDFNAKAQVAAVYNMGTKQDPVAAMKLRMWYNIKPKLPIQNFQVWHDFHITGKGDFRKLH